MSEKKEHTERPNDATSIIWPTYCLPSLGNPCSSQCSCSLDESNKWYKLVKVYKQIEKNLLVFAGVKLKRAVCGMLMWQTSGHVTHASSTTSIQQVMGGNKHMTGLCAALGGYISSLQNDCFFPQACPTFMYIRFLSNIKVLIVIICVIVGSMQVHKQIVLYVFVVFFIC